MTMKTPLIFALLIASTATVINANAQTYQWKDSSGRTVISDTPPPASVRNAKAIGTSPPPSIGAPTTDASQATGGAQSADAPKTTGEKDMEFKKRQQEAKEKADKDAKETAAATQKRENCERARTHLSALESGRRMILPDGKGGETFLEDAQRGDEIERTRNTIAESCK
jgi:hypothetical protein